MDYRQDRHEGRGSVALSAAATVAAIALLAAVASDPAPAKDGRGGAARGLPVQSGLASAAGPSSK